ncbi:MAG: DUF362 domain-containing protein [Candidatus Hinthialibacter antarcticus]|nr:DUF362 domain-containing protein [Candidatus Hinthialibacter antarcticus]
MRSSLVSSRRQFLKTSMVAGCGLLAPALTWALPFDSPRYRQERSQVGLSAGEDRAQNIFNALKPFSEEIKQKIGDKQIVIKPNNVSIDRQLSATHVGSLAGIMEFLNSIGKTNYMIAESAASGPTMDGFDNYGYLALEKNYKPQFVDLDARDYQLVHVVSDKDFYPHPVRMSKLLLDPDTFVISAAVMKTHDRVVATLSLKNIVFGAPIKDEGFRWGSGGKKGAKNDKPIAHGGGYRGVNFNLFALADRLHPDLAVIDGYQGMEGNGPVGGTPVEHRVAVASTDWLAADRTGVELMGIDFDNVGYLNYCAAAGMGQADLSKIDVLGADIQSNQRKYKLSDSIDRQLIWKEPFEI